MATKILELRYDDTPNDVIDKVNVVLRQLGFDFKDTDESLEGSVRYKLRIWNECECSPTSSRACERGTKACVVTHSLRERK